MIDQRLLTAEEAAEILRLTVFHVVKLCREGKLPATKPAGRWLIGENDLREHIASSSNQVGGAA